MGKLEHWLEKLIFLSRWLQAPLYLGLSLAGVLYAYVFLREFVHLCLTVRSITEEVAMLTILTLIDITMVANLLFMVLIGGYSTFVSRLDLEASADRPDWLEHMSAGSLKVKLATSLVTISGVHLLKSFINVEHRDTRQLTLQIAIHTTFLVSALILAWCERLMAHARAGGEARHRGDESR